MTVHNALLVGFVAVAIGIAIGWACAANYWKVTELPSELKTMAAWSYGPYILLMAKPGARLVNKDKLPEIRADEDRWRSPLWSK